MTSNQARRSILALVAALNRAAARAPRLGRALAAAPTAARLAYLREQAALRHRFHAGGMTVPAYLRAFHAHDVAFIRRWGRGR